MIQFKSSTIEVKDIDSVSRRVKIGLSSFGNLDSDNDVITMGAFAKSIQERGPQSLANRKIQYLRYHDFEHQIGKFEALEETHDHLLAVATLGRSTKGSDAFLDYEDGIILEHSIGFNIVSDKTFIREDGVRELRELFLWEGSAVTFGSNSNTPVFNVGKGNRTEYLDKLNAKMNGLINALKNGKGTDERLFQIEMDLRVVQSKYNSLVNLESDEPLKVEEPNEEKSNLSLKNFM